MNIFEINKFEFLFKKTKKYRSERINFVINIKYNPKILDFKKEYVIKLSLIILTFE